MKLSRENFFLFVPREKNPMPYWRALAIVQKIFCGRMTAKGMCNSRCENCRESISNAFQLENANNAEALLTWLLKNAVAKIQEQPEEPYTPKVNIFGLVEDASPFREYMMKL